MVDGGGGGVIWDGGGVGGGGGGGVLCWSLYSFTPHTLTSTRLQSE